ncbi:MAG: diaminopimelate epimerase [bacterium (Candidatus Stahlbacteria) CG23_combo_of_CG06-09_8_20_14_all_34_7]|nr:MAG: diaminopimelate epimerase [bacterium (Candidatus Stahlbacteria) CG23_combo_of_CG06-09_8_20_14_all_34_7]
MKIKEFVKISGSGNDFIMVDNRGGLKNPSQKHIKEICAKGTGVGSDGLIFLESPQKNGDFRMVYYNRDGREADMCGNGGRAVALYARLIGAVKKNTMLFESRKSIHRAELKKNNLVKIELQKPNSLKRDIVLKTSRGIIGGTYINTGVPHFVIFVNDIEKTDVNTLGREIRFHKKFGKQGTNVDFIESKKNKILMRTYERGVESETLACGTGAAASAIVYNLLKGKKSPIKIQTRSKEVLTVYFNENLNDIFLEGKVTIVYEGMLLI